MARRFGTTERTLNRKFRQRVGMTPVAFRQSQRIALAKRLLEAGQRSLESIVAQCGYSDAASFRERLVFYPNFDESDDWRLRSETSFDAAFAASWALRVSYLYTRDNLPAPGFEKADGSTAVSLVWKR